MANHSGPIVGRRDSLVAIACETCNFIHLDPIPDNDKVYTGGAYHRHIKPDYRKEYDEDSEWWNAVYGDWLSLISKRTSNTRLLDVGAGTGHFVYHAEDMGFHSIGIEADDNMVIEGGDIFWSRYEDWTYLNYGIISAHWVLEHLPDPNHFLQWTRDRLVDDGLLLLTIPNDFSAAHARIILEAHELGYYWLNAMHINYWDKQSFSSLLKRNGYEVLSVYGSWEPEDALLNGQNYLADHKLGRKLHRNRMEHDLALTREKRMEKYLKLGSVGRGRDLTFLARKVN